MTFNAKEIAETVIRVVKSGRGSLQEDEEFIAHELQKAHAAGIAQGRAEENEAIAKMADCPCMDGGCEMDSFAQKIRQRMRKKA